MTIARRTAVATLALTAALLPAGDALAVGEGDLLGFPSWAERVQHQLANRARVDVELEMDACGANCAERDCYEVSGPLYYNPSANRAARFHAAHLNLNGYFSHTTRCVVTSAIADT